MKPIQRSLSILILFLIPILLAACATPPNVAPANDVSPSPTPLPMPDAMSTESESTGPATGPVEMPAASADLTGASLFRLSCSACHGKDRLGNKLEVDEQTIEVPALTWDDLNNMYSENPDRGNVSDQLKLAITKGQEESGEEMNAMMPRWSSLSQAQLDSLIQFLQTAGSGDIDDSNLSSVATSLQGEQLFLTACAACHGVDGAGKTFEEDGNTIKTPSLRWSELNDMYSANPDRGNVSDQLVVAITKGQDEDGEDMSAMMPRWSFLSQAQVDSLIQYLQTAFK